MTTGNTGNKPKNSNRGYIAPNQKSNDRQPDWRGKATLDGKLWLVSGWFKNVTDNKGQTAQIVSLEYTDPDTLPPKPDQGSGQTYQAQSSSGAPSNSAAPSGQQTGSAGGDGGAGVFDDIFGGPNSSF